MGRILVANQVLLASLWYLAACWNPSPKMCSRVRGVIRNFIWGGKDTPACAKVRWDTVILPTALGGLGVTDPKSQSEALLAKLFVRGLTPGGEPLKELVQHRADQTKLPVHGKGPSNADFNWLFAAPKLKKLQNSIWRSIVEAWQNVRPGLSKKEPSIVDKVMRQAIFRNPSILSTRGTPLGVSGLSEGRTLAQSGCTRIKDLWYERNKDWKSLTTLRLSHHRANREARDLITNSIPWRLDELGRRIKVGDSVGKPTLASNIALDWVYFVLECTPDTAKTLEYKRTTPGGRLQATTNQPITMATKGYLSTRVLYQECSGSALKIARDPPDPSKKRRLYWIHETGCIQDLPWDPGEWHWHATPPLGDAPFFGYTAKRGYLNARKSDHPSRMTTFLEGLNLRNTTPAQLTARVWHNARPRKVGTLIWLTLNQGLLIGTWLQRMGIDPSYKVCNLNAEESAQHCLMECPAAQIARKAYTRVWDEWQSPNNFIITWPFILLGEATIEQQDDPHGLLAYHAGGFTYPRQPLDILRSFILYHLCMERCKKHFGEHHSLSNVLNQAWVATVEVGMTLWKAIRSQQTTRDPVSQDSIEHNFRNEWLHRSILGTDNATIRWHFLVLYKFF